MIRLLYIFTCLIGLAGCVEQLPPAFEDPTYDMTPTTTSGQVPGEVQTVDFGAETVDAGQRPDAQVVPDAQPRPDAADAQAPMDAQINTPMDSEPQADAAPEMVSAPELCDGLDNDLDGEIDEDFDVDGLCAVGVGACEVVGNLVCDGEDGVVCAALAGQPSDETCNEIDDDCDGQIDEDFDVFAECSVGIGACQRLGLTLCDGPDVIACNAMAGEPTNEICNELDDDCDGEVDEALGLGEPCNVGVGLCSASGEVVCGRDERPECSATPGEPQVEMCNGLDDDCDDRIDEETNCGTYVEQNCQLWLGWADDNEGPETPSATWAECPRQDTSMEGNVRCVGTRRDGRFRVLTLPTGYYRMDYNDELAVNFTCEDDGTGHGDWLASHCAVYLGHADYNEGPADPSPSWSDCPERNGQNEGRVRCVGSAFDGQFHHLTTSGVINSDDDFGLAFRCTDEENPQRQALAEKVTREVEVQFGWAKSPNRTPDDGAENWPNCAGGADELRRRANCVSSGGDGQFHRMDMSSTVDGYNNRSDEDAFGIAIKARVID